MSGKFYDRIVKAAARKQPGTRIQCDKRWHPAVLVQVRDLRAMLAEMDRLYKVIKRMKLRTDFAAWGAAWGAAREDL